MVVRRWRHVIRRLDSRGRFPLPEAVMLGGGGDGSLAATLRPDRWELWPASRSASGGVLDSRLRVRLPLGVRHHLGLEEAVLVSVALDLSRLVVWPSSRLDDFLEER